MDNKVRTGTSATLFIGSELRPVPVLGWELHSAPTIAPENIDWADDSSFTVTLNPINWRAFNRMLHRHQPQSARHIAHAAYGLRRKGSQGWRRQG
jgi:hypothetical protein